MTPSTLLDIALLLMLGLQALAGAREGIVRNALLLAGTVGGVGLALWATPRLMTRWQLTSPSIRLAVLVCAAWVGATLGRLLSRRLAARLSPGRDSLLRRFDATLGAAAALVVSSLLLWLVGAAARPLLPVEWAGVLNHSKVLSTIDEAVPTPVKSLPGRFTRELDTRFPQVFSGLSPEPLIPVPAPDAKVSNSAAIRAAAKSVVKVQTSAPSCGSNFVGSGWVVSRERVVTNAHVVAGARTISVRVGNSLVRHEAEVVAFNPDLDLAVLRVDGLDAPALKRAPAQSRGASTVVAGYPLGGPYTLAASRVRGVVQASGDDIYGGAGVRREVYSLRTVVEHGNSGGPLLTTDGRVAGTVFAKSLADRSTGYALTDAATDAVLDRAAQLSRPIATGGCVAG